MNPTTTAGERLLDYNHSRLVAVLDSCAAAQAAAAGFTQSFDVHCGTAGARLIDFDGSQHGPLARMSHALHHLTVEGEHMHHYESELQAGHCIVMVRTKGADERHRALAIVNAHGGHFIKQFGYWAVETVQSSSRLVVPRIHSGSQGVHA